MGIGRGGMCCSVALQQGEILHGLGAKPWCWVFPPPPPPPPPSRCLPHPGGNLLLWSKIPGIIPEGAAQLPGHCLSLVSHPTGTWLSLMGTGIRVKP